MKKLSEYKNIVVLTGAGISKDSGIPTYRGEGGLWNNPDLEKLSSVDTFNKDPKLVIDFFRETLKLVNSCEPNEAHRLLIEIEKSAENFTLITQNIDGYHQRAGSKNVLEIHGSLTKDRCVDYNCDYTVASSEGVLVCPKCGKLTRPEVVLFGEMLPVHASHYSHKAVMNCDLFIAIGTSGTVWPAARFVDSAQYAGADTVYINVEPTDNICFSHQILKGATEGLKELMSF